MHYVYVYMRGLSLFPTERVLNIALLDTLSVQCLSATAFRTERILRTEVIPVLEEFIERKM